MASAGLRALCAVSVCGALRRRSGRSAWRAPGRDLVRNHRQRPRRVAPTLAILRGRAASERTANHDAISTAGMIQRRRAFADMVTHYPTRSPAQIFDGRGCGIERPQEFTRRSRQRKPGQPRAEAFRPDSASRRPAPAATHDGPRLPASAVRSRARPGRRPLGAGRGWRFHLQRAGRREHGASAHRSRRGTSAPPLSPPRANDPGDLCRFGSQTRRCAGNLEAADVPFDAIGGAVVIVASVSSSQRHAPQRDAARPGRARAFRPSRRRCGGHPCVRTNASRTWPSSVVSWRKRPVAGKNANTSWCGFRMNTPSPAAGTRRGGRGRADEQHALLDARAPRGGGLGHRGGESPPSTACTLSAPRSAASRTSRAHGT